MPSILDILTGAGAALDLPGSSVRDVLAGQNPIDQYRTPFSFGNRTTGRGLLEQYGMLDPNQQGFDMGDVAGFGAEVALDPLNLLGIGAVRSAAKSAGRMKAARQALRGGNLETLYSREPGAVRWMTRRDIPEADTLLNERMGLPAGIAENTRGGGSIFPYVYESPEMPGRLSGTMAMHSPFDPEDVTATVPFLAARDEMTAARLLEKALERTGMRGSGRHGPTHLSVDVPYSGPERNVLSKLSQSIDPPLLGFEDMGTGYRATTTLPIDSQTDVLPSALRRMAATDQFQPMNPNAGRSLPYLMAALGLHNVGQGALQ